MSKGIAKAQSMPALKQVQTVELKKRVLTAVDRYPGLKNSGEYVAARVTQARDKDRLAEKEYWAHLKKFKEEVKSVFKLPQDTYAGKRSVQEEINEKVEKGQRALAETDEAYQLWLKEMEKRQQERCLNERQQRRNEIEDLQNRKQEMQAALLQELSEKAAGFKEKEKAYWNWLADAKQAVAARPGVAPLYKFDGKSVEEMEQQKHEQMMEKVRAKINADREDIERREKAMHALEEKMSIVKAEEAGHTTWPRIAVLLWMLQVTQAAIPRVAVIGAGISGGSAVHFLRNLLGDEVEIVVYEASDQPGGRTLTRTFANMTIDVGGTAIYSKNKYVSGFAKLFNLLPEEDNSTNSMIGIWDGSKIRIELDTDSSWLAGAKALLRYGFTPLRIIPAVRETVKKFDRIYELQEQNQSFSSPEDLLMALGLFNFTQVSAYDYFSQLGVNDLFTKELIDGASRCNYNQAGNMNSFTDLISLAGAGVAGHVFSLANGTQDISKALVKAANRLRLNDKVTEIYADDAELGYVVVSKGPTEPRKEHFAGVIVATPLEMAGIKLPADAQQRAGHGREYQTTYVTFVHGRLNATYFSHGDPMKTRELPAALFTPEDSSSPFVSFSIHKVFADDSVVVKLFSRVELKDFDVGQIFVKVFEIFRWTWKAYPKLQPLSPDSWASFRLDKRALFYTSGLETSASAMEVAALLTKEALTASRYEFPQVPLQRAIIGSI